MLFGEDVNMYLEDVDKTARDFYVSAQGMSESIAKGDQVAIEKDATLMNYLGVTLLQRRKGLFQPYFTL